MKTPYENIILNVSVYDMLPEYNIISRFFLKIVLDITCSRTIKFFKKSLEEYTEINNQDIIGFGYFMEACNDSGYKDSSINVTPVPNNMGYRIKFYNTPMGNIAITAIADGEDTMKVDIPEGEYKDNFISYKVLTTNSELGKIVYTRIAETIIRYIRKKGKS